MYKGHQCGGMGARSQLIGEVWSTEYGVPFSVSIDSQIEANDNKRRLDEVGSGRLRHLDSHECEKSLMSSISLENCTYKTAATVSGDEYMSITR